MRGEGGGGAQYKIRKRGRCFESGFHLSQGVMVRNDCSLESIPAKSQSLTV